MEKMNIEPIVMNNKYSKIFIHPLIGNFNEATGRGWFAVSLKDYENQPLENKVFGEEWDVVDATYPGEKYYYTWIKVTYFGNKVPVKVTYSNGTHKWKSMNDLLDDIKNKSFDNAHGFRITEMRIRPYRYTDDYGHNRIAGQLQFVGVESDETYYPKFISDQLPDEIDKMDIPEEVEKAVAIESPTLPETVLEEVVPKIDIMELTKDVNKVTKAIEEEKEKREKRDKLFTILALVGLTPREALDILVKNAY